MLYPKADQQRRVMVFACRICDYDEIGENKCVYRNDLLTVTKCATLIACGGGTVMLMVLQGAGRRHDGLGLGPYACTLARPDVPELWKPRVRTSLIIYILTNRPVVVYVDSSVFFQDQSKRRETRMILFYVCTNCNHAFTDPNLQTDVQNE